MFRFIQNTSNEVDRVCKLKNKPGVDWGILGPELLLLLVMPTTTGTRIPAHTLFERTWCPFDGSKGWETGKQAAFHWHSLVDFLTCKILHRWNLPDLTRSSFPTHSSHPPLSFPTTSPTHQIIHRPCASTANQSSTHLFSSSW
jgi:hypothetical protein